ncbi:MAG TPA: DeoR/GlpR family DNA-binding transcription regulator [Solirubrobacterales bacterium]|nr:DeoR/GlpR family DNA-binding transcription regulator [Solirubrobacterales bacterium]
MAGRKDLSDGAGQLSVAGRHEQIESILLTHNEVSVQELVERFGVSLMTVHRDLDALEARGVLRKVRGGATAQPSTLYESSFAFRVGENQEAKRAIGRLAARHVKPGSSIALDDSTTALAMIPHLRGTSPLTMLTNFRPAIDAVREMAEESIQTILVGGAYQAKYDSFGGSLTENWLGEFRVDQCFLSVSAIDLEHGAFHQETDQAAVKRALLGIAEQRVLLADASKFSRRAMHRIVDFTGFDLAIVDRETPAEVLASLRSRGLEVEVAAGSGEGDFPQNGSSA